MKKCALVVSVLCGLAIVTEAMEERKVRQLVRVPTTGKSVLMVNAGGALSAQDIEKVRATAESNMGVAVRTITSPNITSTNFLLLGAECAGLLTSNDAYCIVYSRADSTTRETCVMAPDQHWLAVNVSALKTPKTEHDVFIRRIGQQTLRCMALALGVGYTLDPKCVSKPISQPSDLDSMGENFSMLARERFERETARVGITKLVLRPKRSLVDQGHIEKEEGEGFQQPASPHSR